MRRLAVAGAAGNRWHRVSPGRSYGAARRRADPTLEPAPPPALGHNAASWCWERPSTTICGANPGIVNPGGGGPNVSMSERGYIPVGDWPAKRPATTIQGDQRVAPPGHHEHDRDKTAIRVQLWELGVLQGFPVDHPWQPPGRASQVGNAICPPLAEACLRALVTTP